MDQYTTTNSNSGKWAPSPSITNDVERVLALDEISASISMANERLGALLRDARQHADSIFGSQPANTGAVPSAPKPTGRLHSLRENVEGAHSLIAALHDELSRLRGI